MKKLREKRILVTAGGQGLGQAIARELGRCGCHLAVHYFSSRSGAEEIKNEVVSSGGRCEVFRADLTREEEARRMVRAAIAFLGGLDILVNNAGDLVERRRIEEIDTAFWEKSFSINLTSTMWVTREAVPSLAAAGNSAIVNLSSLAGRKGGHPGSLAYSTAKGAVLTWTRALAAELGPKGIRVNAVAPGLILGTRFHATHTTAESAARTVEEIPLKRAGRPEDVARAVAYLASEYDGFVTGATLDVNGGVYCA